MKILIVEDEAVIAVRIRRMVSMIMNLREENIVIVPSLEKAIYHTVEHPVDVVFLDLNLNGRDGMQLLQTSAAASFHTIIISAYREKAIEAFEYGVLDFVAKPFTEERLRKALSKIDTVQNRTTPVKHIAIRMQGQIRTIDPSEIMYIKAAGDYSYLHLENGTKLLHNKSLEKLQALLAPAFTRIHKSIIVRLDAVKLIRINSGSRYEVELFNKELLPVSRMKYKLLKNMLAS